MRNWIILSLFVLIVLTIAASPAMAALGAATWTQNNDIVLNVANGQSAQFEYRVQAVTSKNGHFSINLYREGQAAPIYTYINNQASVNNGANGYVTVNPSDYGNTLGNYYVVITSVDDFGTDYFKIELVVGTSAFSVACTAVPSNGYAPLNVTLASTINGNSPSYTLNWNYGDGKNSAYNVSGTSNTITHVYGTGSFNPSLTVTDKNGSSMTANCGNVNVMMPSLDIQNINCFSRVIDGQNQSCGVTVTSNNGLTPGNVNINVYYSNGQLFGSCLTNSLSGACTVDNIVHGVGTYSVYATASANGYINDTDKQPTYTFDIYSQKYNVINLATYSDSNFISQSSTFYRGQPLYIKFQVYDPSANQFVTNDIVTAATLVSLAGGHADLSRMTYNGNWYYYKLDSVPLTHAFIGNSNVFAFTFNFTGLSGGQAQVALTILNNNPTINSIPDVYVDRGQTTLVSLNNYGRDIEDGTLQWNVLTSNGNVFASAITTGNILSITGNVIGNGAITLRGFDLDNAYADTNINVHVVNGINITNNTIIVSCTATPTSGNAPLGVMFNAVANGGTGTYNYNWDFNDNGQITTTASSISHTYNNIGTYNPLLTVTDSSNHISIVSCGLISVGNGVNGTGPIFSTGGPYTGYLNQALTLDASKTTGSISKYSWDFGDGTSADATTPTIQHIYTAIDRYDITLTVTYSDGTKKSGSTTATIIEQNSPPKVVAVKTPDRGILVENIVFTGGDSGEILGPNDDLTADITIKNQWTGKLKNVYVSISIPELGLESRSSSFDLTRGEDQTQSVTLPLFDVPPGVYYLKISAGNGNVYRTKYREIEVTK